ncbi:hypothetical protein [Vibrio phage J14]|nr:hypothetical protein [Vibrio phage J14]
MSWVSDVVTTALSGGVTGVLGVALSGFFTWKEKANERAHEFGPRRARPKRTTLRGRAITPTKQKLKLTPKYAKPRSKHSPESFLQIKHGTVLGDTSGANKALIFV